MKRSFAERRYSPSIGMDQSEWEIILEQLAITGYIVKEEPVSETDDSYVLCWLACSVVLPSGFFVLLYHLHAICLDISPSRNLFRCIAFVRFISLCHLRAIYFIVSPSSDFVCE
jgi:hypothetical protein